MKDAGTVILTITRTLMIHKTLTKVKLFFFGYGEQEERIVKGLEKDLKCLTKRAFAICYIPAQVITMDCLEKIPQKFVNIFKNRKYILFRGLILL